MFVSQNLANAGNLAFNSLFSRIMGPTLFADLALLLTMKLGVMSLLAAVQFAVAKEVASKEPGERTALIAGLARLHVASVFCLLLLTVALAPLAALDPTAEVFGVDSRWALPLLVFALPITAPLCIARGVAQGRLNVGPLAVSAILEMAVRLVGGLVLWGAGFGIEGVAVAIALSLFAGWLPLRGTFTSAMKTRNVHTNQARLAARIGAIALPFAVLQVSQVAHLDGEVILANALLEGSAAGLVAILSLVQRIQFYACIGLAGVLLPAVAFAAAHGRSLIAAIKPIILLFCVVSAIMLAFAAIAPATVVQIVGGEAFSDASQALFPAVVSAVFFTFSYLAATCLAGIDDRRGIFVVGLFVPIQGFVLWAASLLSEPDELNIIFAAKALTQGALAAVLLALLLTRLASQIKRSRLSDETAMTPLEVSR
jgi:O-antigen/teichoic acid export membrane protein